jgi:phenylalanyl-tRNA synthetase alpha chain
MTQCRLTEEGKEYARSGLPEQQLVQTLDSFPQKSATIGKIVGRVKNFPVALKWALEKGWVMKKADEIVLLKKPDLFDLQEALKKIDKGQEAEQQLVEVLMQRQLVEKIVAIKEEVKKLAGQEVTFLTPEIIKTGTWQKVRFKPYNVEAVGQKKYPGKRQPYIQFLLEVRQKLVELGFKEMIGPMIETEFWNFDALFQPQNHPARDWSQTYSLKQPKSGSLPESKIVAAVKNAHEKGIAGSVGWQYKWNPQRAMQLMPRAHGTAVSARTLAAGPNIPGKYFSFSRCFRPDVIDVTHGVEFIQAEGIVVDESLNFKTLLGILKMFATEIAGAEKVKFMTDYYPFTEPSCQLSAKHPDLGWIEFGGSGIFREELTKPLGVDVPVLAWGIGIDRLAMFKLNIDDIRKLFTQDLNWLRKQPIVR